MWREASLAVLLGGQGDRRQVQGGASSCGEQTPRSHEAGNPRAGLLEGTEGEVRGSLNMRRRWLLSDETAAGPLGSPCPVPLSKCAGLAGKLTSMFKLASPPGGNGSRL